MRRLCKCNENAKWIIAYDVCESASVCKIKMPSACTVHPGFYSRARNGKEMGTTLTPRLPSTVCLGLAPDQNLILYCVSIGWLADTGHSSETVVPSAVRIWSQAIFDWKAHSATISKPTLKIWPRFSHGGSHLSGTAWSRSCVGGFGATEFYSHVRRVFCSRCW